MEPVHESNWRFDRDPWAQPVIKFTVEAEDPKNTNLTGNFFEGIDPTSLKLSGSIHDHSIQVGPRFYDLFK